jgi:hypothetical protein
MYLFLVSYVFISSATLYPSRLLPYIHLVCYLISVSSATLFISPVDNGEFLVKCIGTDRFQRRTGA